MRKCVTCGNWCIGRYCEDCEAIKAPLKKNEHKTFSNKHKDEKHVYDMDRRQKRRRDRS